ncbi:MAG: carbon starvation protein A, partial [Oligoflexia bacterium]|nr:carbon starvation protein A [Oligoflexia bacterium]
MITIFFIVTVLIFIFSYKYYGNYISGILGLDNCNKTPSHYDYDGIDRVPANKAILLGHHFSSIAGAGPIVGPIIAALAFGWLPVFLWIILGAIFIGGVHDFSSLVASIRHKAKSIAEISKNYMNNTVYKIFLIFIWLSIIYILIVFIDLTSSTFVSDTGVAVSSSFFILLAIFFGLTIYRFKLSIIKSSLIFVPLVFLSAFAGKLLPLDGSSIPVFLGSPAKTWNLILIVYCFIASTTPVWILLQPRDYLSSFLLYATVIGAFTGILFGGFDFNYPAFVTWNDPVLGTLFPVLFITVACGACSGFHSIIASGTTSKQLNQECDAKPIGYGSMLIEGIIAVIALVIVITLPFPLSVQKSPLMI